MEGIIAVVVIGGLIWFGLAIIASRRDENGMDAQDRYELLDASERAMAAAGFVRRPGAPTNREMIDALRDGRA